MIYKVNKFKQFVNENYNQNKFDILKLSKEFLAIDNEMSDLIKKSDSLAEDGIGKQSWERYKELEQIRIQKVKDIFIGNKSDDMYDEVHDVILSDDDVSTMPDGYSATIITSYYNSIMKYYNTIAVVKTPNNNEYLIDVPTYSKIKIGKNF